MNVSCACFKKALHYEAKDFTAAIVDVGFQFVDNVFVIAGLVGVCVSDQHGAKDSRAFVGSFAGSDADFFNFEILRKCFAGAHCGYDCGACWGDKLAFYLGNLKVQAALLYNVGDGRNGNRKDAVLAADGAGSFI